MAKALVIAEKPSLGRSIVSAISWWKNEKFSRQGKDRNTWLESDNYGQSSSAKVCGGTRPSMVVTFDGSKHKFRCE